MILQVKKKAIIRDEGTSARHEALLVCLMAWGNKKSIPSDSDNDSDSDDELTSYDEIVQENLNFSKVCTSQQKKLEKLKEKLDSSQQAYATLLEQYETFVNINMELSTKIEQLKTMQTQIIAQSMMSNLKRKMKN